MTFEEKYGIACDEEVPEYQEQPTFDDACERYRAMRREVENQPYEKQLEAINRFRSGKYR